MKREIVHMIGTEEGAELATGDVREVVTRCGRKIARPIVDGVPSRYHMIAHNGNEFECTTRQRFVSCVKCMNLLNIGTIYDKDRRTGSAAKRASMASPSARASGRPGTYRHLSRTGWDGLRQRRKRA